MSTPHTTQLLKDATSGDAKAAKDLFPLVYDELHALAEQYFRQQPKGHTLQPTALVHETYLRMVDESLATFEDRNHFVAIAARVMRLVLVDHTRRRLAEKRGGRARRVPLEDETAFTHYRGVDLLALEELLTRLEQLDERKAKIVELRFFLGMTINEAADVLGISPKTVEKDWHGARAWLRLKMQ